jgi:hypothetical protein
VLGDRHAAATVSGPACSAAIGIYYLVAFAGIASGAGNSMINIAFTVALALSWAWLTALCVRALGGKA